MTDITIDEFQERVVGLRPNNFMALNGAAPGIVGASSTGAAVILELQRSVIALARLYKSGTNDEALQLARRDVLGKIMVALTVDAISEQTADELVGNLQQLMKGRK